MNKNLKENFITKANKIHDFKYDYSDAVYINNKTQLEIKCIEHNTVFLQRPDNHLHGFLGCKECSKEHRVSNTLEKYGVEHISQAAEVKRKRQQTNLSKYGNVCSLHDGGIIEEKTKQTNMLRYGIEYGFQSEEIKEKIKQTILERYNVEYITQSTEIKEKIKQTNLLKYGVENNAQQNIFPESLRNLNNKEWLYEQHVINQKTLCRISQEQNVCATLAGKYLYKHGISVKRFARSEGEKSLNEFILSLDYSTLTNSRDIISPFELDIFIPTLNIALEYNGLHWHRDKGVNYHKNKTELCKMKNIHLIHVWEDQWLNNQEDMKNKIIKIINQQPLHELREELIIDLSLEDPDVYLSLGYNIVEYLQPKECYESIWDCGSVVMDK